ncbi:MAG: hypothetical protein FWF49_01980 [Oscillospiraceae bacterium]|nr:hypothetical protein [Oscillospiraceae bacterium]
MLVFTLVNLLLMIVQANLYFLFSASMPIFTLAFFQGMASAAENDAIVVMGFIAAFVLTVPYFIFWLLGKRHRVLMLVAMILFSADTLLLVGLIVLTVLASTFSPSNILDVVFHAFVLFYLINGTVAWAKLRGENLNDLNMNVGAFNTAAMPPPNANAAADAQSVPLSMRTITVARKKALVGAAVKTNICIDGAVVATFKNGQSGSFAVDSRPHNLCATTGMTGAMSNVIQIDASENDAKFLLSMKMSGNGMLILTPDESCK